MKTRDIEIDFNGKKEVVTIKKMTFGEKNDLMQQAIPTKVLGGQVMAELKHGTLKELSLLKAITKAPFTISMGEIRNLDPEVGEKLYQAIDKLNSVTPQKKET